MNTSLRFQTWLAVLVGLLLNCCPISAVETNDRIYAEFDLEFKTFLALANDRIGKEVIKVERLSDRFTVPQKLTIKGTPHEIGLALGHIGQQAKARLPMLTETNRALNRKVVELYQKIYPQFLEVVRGVAEVYKEPVEQIDVGVFEADFTTRLGAICSRLNGLIPRSKGSSRQSIRGNPARAMPSTIAARPPITRTDTSSSAGISTIPRIGPIILRPWRWREVTR